MESKFFTKAAICAAVLSGWISSADVVLPEIFASHMVLQRETQVPVWGTASAGENVSVKFNGQEQTTQADQSGKWNVEFSPMAAGGPFKLEVAGNNTITLDDVLIGEVWLCSGQSNMEWAVRSSDNPQLEISNASHPQIRLFHVKKASNASPQTEMALESSWRACTPESIPNFSAVGYFFGRKLNQDLNVPVGLINSSWGGTRIEPWTPPVGFASVPSLDGIATELVAKTPGTAANIKLAQGAIDNYRKWITQAESALAGNRSITPPSAYPAKLAPYTSHQSPAMLYNAMIHPMVPYAMRGAIWYQGESNRDDRKLYADKMKALIHGWRSIWSNDEMPFYFVQLAPFKYGNQPDALAEIWEAQTEISQQVAGTGMAVINDIGNVKDIHPRNKQDVGKRLALLALNKTYGKKEIVCDSPTFKELKITDNSITVTFNSGVGLTTRDGQAPTWFEICGADADYKRADAKIVGDTVVLTAAGVAKPFALRFAWDHVAEPNLMNAAGLPAGAFRAGEIPVPTLSDLIPESKAFKIVYTLDPSNCQASNGGNHVVYTSDKSAEITGEIEKIGYALFLNEKDYIFVAMDAFTQDLSKIAVPTVSSQAVFQQHVRNLMVKSNVKGIQNGNFAQGGNIEFWSHNYGPANAKNITGASAGKYDFGDQMVPPVLGYGSMQVHNHNAKQTLFSFNNFKSGKNADLGIGNHAGANPDWTFSANAGQYNSAKMYIMVKTK
jgi:sialate O-acetylesterase